MRSGTWTTSFTKREWQTTLHLSYLLQPLWNQWWSLQSRIGYQQCDLFSNCSVFMLKITAFPRPVKLGHQNKQPFRFQGYKSKYRKAWAIYSRITLLPFAFNREAWTFFRACLVFKRNSFPDNCIDCTNENVSSGARNYECLSKKCSTFCSRGVQVWQNKRHFSGFW